MTETNLVNHTHWDREWYFTTMDALVLSDQLFTEVLDELEKNEDANFCLDGQVSIVDEYVEIHPEALARIQKLVKAGRLFVGPWYTQTDALLPDAESIIRNLVIGINDTKQTYGQPMMIGYLPDTFGFNAQMPTLLSQVGIDNFIFWRGTNFKRQMNSVYFKWRGLSGKEVIAANFPFGYFTAQIDVASKRHLDQFVTKRFDPAAEFEATHAHNDEVLMPSGIDQMDIIKNISETIADLNRLSDNHTTISTYPKFIDKLRQRDDLPTYHGELRLPTYDRVHRTIGSVRHNIKMENVKLEQKILRRVEPLTVIAKANGVTIGNGLLIKLWKKLLECQAHDTLGGSVSDNVAVDIMHRFKEANEIADGIENMITKKLAEFLKLDDHSVLVFNTDPTDFDGVKSIDLVASSKRIVFDNATDAYIVKSHHYPVRHHILMMTPRGREFMDEPEYYQLTFKTHVTIPALGYKVLHFHESNQVSAEMKPIQTDELFLKLGSQKVSFEHGQLNYCDGQRQITDLIRLVDSGNDGDTYDYSPLANDVERDLAFQTAHLESAGVQQQLIVTGETSLPAALADRVTEDPELKPVHYQLTLNFNEQGLLTAKLDFDNQVCSHRLRLKLNGAIKTDAAIAQIQAGFVTTHNEPIDDDWLQEFVEKPVNLYNFDKTVSMTDSQHTLTFFGKGMKEYQQVDNRLYITLMATTSQLGKPNLAWRPGRASGDTTNQGHIMMPTPLAEEQGELTFEFALGLSDSGFSEQATSLAAQRWFAPSISYQLQQLNLFIHRLDNKIWETDEQPAINPEFSLLTLDKSLLVSAIYPAYTDSKAYIVRIQNPTREVVSLPAICQQAEIVDALEQPVDHDLIVDPYNMLTLKFNY